MATQKAWENYWRLLAKYAPTSVHEQAAYAASLQRLVTPGMEWLDAGCGHNVIAPWLKNSAPLEKELLGRARLVVGCDRDVVSLEKDSPIRRLACDLGDLPFRDESFDLVTCNMVVEHLEKPAEVFREFFRVLKGGGQVLILTPNLYHWSMLLSAMTPHMLHVMARKHLFGSEEEDVFPTLYRSNTPSAMRKHLQGAGFKHIDVELLSSQPHLVGMGPLLYLDFLFHRLTVSFPSLREILHVTARKTV
jgi:ubiquinone/menaquinone biosynthesis C-methylase UbiE